MKENKYKYIIGIDPDCGGSPDEYGIATKGGSGVAIYSTETGHVKLMTLTFCELITVLMMRHDKPEVQIAVEASWLTYKPSTNWHSKSGDRKGVLARKGYDVGRCHEVGRKIVEVARTCGYAVELQRPLKKIWQGEDGKITDGELRRIIHIDKAHTNQEERDATLIALHVAGHSMRMKTEDEDAAKMQQSKYGQLMVAGGRDTDNVENTDGMKAKARKRLTKPANAEKVASVLGTCNKLIQDANNEAEKERERLRKFLEGSKW